LTAAIGPAFAPAEVRRIVAGAGSSFATGMRVLPRARREAIFAVYAFCRVVDDIADGDGDGASKLRRLLWWEEEVARVFEGAPRNAIGGELARAVARYDLPREELDLILEGMRMDAAGVVAPDEAGFERYVRCVAGAVGVLSLRVFGRGGGGLRALRAVARAGHADHQHPARRGGGRRARAPVPAA
jgi:phytoene synthase